MIFSNSAEITEENYSPIEEYLNKFHTIGYNADINNILCT